MTAEKPVPAAIYVRMSTEHQQYSIENQSAAIRIYAENHGFTVVRTYSDPARSGLLLKNRRRLRDLLKDVADGKTDYKAILVYDVSRWGRFQDTDEAAHYEFLCKSAGVPIHYCAETFVNDGSLPSSIMKALKRVMAGEYSRELGVRVLGAHKRLAELGFKQGGLPGYGFRRLLVSKDRTPKQLLAHGEKKSIATDRVTLVPGPVCEIEEVREIFRKFTVDRWSLTAISRDLDQRGVPGVLNGRWNHSTVARLLSHPKYIGCNVFNRVSERLGSAPVRVPRSDWIICPGAHEGIVDVKTFGLAQEILASQTIRKTDEQILQGLRSLLAARGKLSNRIIDKSDGMPCTRTFWHRFGGLRRACELIGYDQRKNGRKSDEEMLQDLRSLLALKGRLSKTILNAIPRLVSASKLKRRFGSQRRAYELIGYDWRKDLSRAQKEKRKGSEGRMMAAMLLTKIRPLS